MFDQLNLVKTDFDDILEGEVVYFYPMIATTSWNRDEIFRSQALFVDISRKNTPQNEQKTPDFDPNLPKISLNEKQKSDIELLIFFAEKWAEGDSFDSENFNEARDRVRRWMS